MTYPQAVMAPAWEYRRSAQWGRYPPGLNWATGKHGDRLLMWLPAEMIALHIPDEAAVESFAWLEARITDDHGGQRYVPGRLPRTWSSRPEKAPPACGYFFYRVQPHYVFHEGTTLAPGVELAASAVPVWPTPTEEQGRYKWYDPDGVPLLAPPPCHEFPWFPADWSGEFMGRGEPQEGPVWPVTTAGWTARFFDDTLLYTGEEQHRLTTETVHDAYEDWAVLVQMPRHYRIGKSQLGRWLSACGYRTGGWRTRAGYRRGVIGIRFPQGGWH